VEKSSGKSKTSHRQRVVIYLTQDLKQQLERRATRSGSTLAEIGRAALIAHLEKIKKADLRTKLADTCQVFTELFDILTVKSENGLE